MEKLRLKKFTNEIHELRPRSIGSSVELLNWLELSWFYPKDFNKRYVIKTPEAYYVVGDLLVYKFLKAQGDRETIDDRLLRAKLEIQLNKELAPDLYLGLRMLRWSNGEPHWMTEDGASNEIRVLSKAGVDEVAIVLRRLRRRSLFLNKLKAEQHATDKKLTKLVALIKNYHSRRKREGLRVAVANKRSLVDELRRRWEFHIKSVSSSEHGDFFNAVHLSLKNSFADFFNRKANYLLHRALSGYFVQLHGNLRADKISMEPLCSEGKEISIFGRISQNNGDVLEDVADLFVDLHSFGSAEVADKFKAFYFSENTNDDEQELFQLLVSIKAFSRVAEASSINSSSKVDASSLLSLAYRYSLGWQFPLVVCLFQEEAIKAGSYGNIFLSFLDAVGLGEGREESEFVDEDVLRDQYFIKQINKLKSVLSQKRNVVFGLSQISSEERLSITKIAEKYGAKLLFIKVRESSAASIDMANVFGFTRLFDQRESGEHVSTFMLDQIVREHRWQQVSHLLGDFFGQKTPKKAK